jgi:hypothetical protein
MRAVIRAAFNRSNGEVPMRTIIALLLTGLTTVVAHAEGSLVGKPVFWKLGAKATLNHAEVRTIHRTRRITP